jgi:hypothetical protein
MSKKKELETALKEAMLAKDQVSRNTLRLVLSAIKEGEIQKKEELEEADILSILQKQVKTRQESLEEAKKVDRNDLVEEAKMELKILEKFMPSAMSDEELTKLVTQHIEAVGASTISDMGKVMQGLLAEVAGRADGGKVSQMVREQLQGS